jgi:uncharacterized BrkB/YihY/UPF0761 family membrane protein
MNKIAIQDKLHLTGGGILLLWWLWLCCLLSLADSIRVSHSPKQPPATGSAYERTSAFLLLTLAVLLLTLAFPLSSQLTADSHSDSDYSVAYRSILNSAADPAILFYHGQLFTTTDTKLQAQYLMKREVYVR